MNLWTLMLTSLLQGLAFGVALGLVSYAITCVRDRLAARADRKASR